MTSKEAPTLTGAEAIHNAALAAALAAIDALVQQEIGEGEYDEDDLMPLVTARVALTSWAEQEAAEYDNDAGTGYGNSAVSASAKPSLTRKSAGMTYKTFTVTTKAPTTGTGEIEAIANTLGVEDRQRDVMEKGCWSDVISKMRGGARPWPTLCWAHKWEEPVGKVTYAEERGNGLFIKGLFNLNTTRGKDAYEDVRFGSIRELSVGFLTAPDGEHFDVKGVRHVTRVSEWPECSFVLVGASPDTRVMSLKDAATAALPDEVFDAVLLQVESEFQEALTDSVLRDAELTALIKEFVSESEEQLNV